MTLFHSQIKTNMKRQPVESSNLKSVGFDKGSSTLEVEFHSGKVYSYCPVSEGMYDELMAADSVGSHFAKAIKANDKLTVLEIKPK